jgi:hypothetical protein
MSPGRGSTAPKCSSRSRQTRNLGTSARGGRLDLIRGRWPHPVEPGLKTLGLVRLQRDQLVHNGEHGLALRALDPHGTQRLGELIGDDADRTASGYYTSYIERFERPDHLNLPRRVIPARPRPRCSAVRSVWEVRAWTHVRPGYAAPAQQSPSWLGAGWQWHLPRLIKNSTAPT